MKLKIFSLIIIILITSFYIYLSTDQLESKSFENNELTTTYIVDNGVIQSHNDSDIGFIFYQGGKVDTYSYSYLLNINAKVFIPKFPFNLAILSQNRADNIIKNNPDIKTWYIGGHSLGGTVAYEYAIEHEDIEGVIMLASYPMNDYSNSKINTLAIFGSNDGLVNYKEKVKLYPKDSQIEVIEGGNHAQFGNYGPQKGDNQALISPKKQRERVTSLINEFIKK